MKKLILILPIIALYLVIGCEKIESPYKPIITLDTTLFSDGIWVEYPWPEFEDISNDKRNVLLEDYTGHRCLNCPNAAKIAKDLEEENLGRVFVASIHTGPGGSTDFQKTLETCGDLVANPKNKFCHDFRTDEGEEYGITFQNGYGFTGNPIGNINRFKSDDLGLKMFTFYLAWGAQADEILNSDLKVNLQAKSNYFEESHGAFVHVEAEFIQAYDRSVNIVTYVIENEIEAWQDSSGFHLEHYLHHNIFTGCMDGLAFGQNLGTSFEKGEKVNFDYSYSLPEELLIGDFHLLIFVSDSETYEVLQVIKHELE